MPRLIGSKCNRDRIEVVIVTHRSRCTAAAGCCPVAEMQGGTDNLGKVAGACNPDLSHGRAVFLDHEVWRTEVQRCRTLGRDIQSNGGEHQRQTRRRCRDVEYWIGLAPARLKHLGNTVEARPQILKGIGAIGIADRRTFAHIQSTVEVGVNEHPPAGQRCFTVIDSISVGVVPDPPTDTGVIVLNKHI